MDGRSATGFATPSLTFCVLNHAYQARVCCAYHPNSAKRKWLPLPAKQWNSPFRRNAWGEGQVGV